MPKHLGNALPGASRARFMLRGAVDRAGARPYNEKNPRRERHSPWLPRFLLVSVAQLVERRTVAPVVEGSNPSAHPTLALNLSPQR